MTFWTRMIKGVRDEQGKYVPPDTYLTVHHGHWHAAMQAAADKHGADDPRVQEITDKYNKAVDGLDMSKEMKSATFLGKFSGSDKPTRDLAKTIAKHAIGRATRAPGAFQ